MNFKMLKLFYLMEQEYKKNELYINSKKINTFQNTLRYVDNSQNFNLLAKGKYFSVFLKELLFENDYHINESKLHIAIFHYYFISESTRFMWNLNNLLKEVEKESTNDLSIDESRYWYLKIKGEKLWKTKKQNN